MFNSGERTKYKFVRQNSVQELKYYILKLLGNEKCFYYNIKKELLKTFASGSIICDIY